MRKKEEKEGKVGRKKERKIQEGEEESVSGIFLFQPWQIKNQL